MINDLDYMKKSWMLFFATISIALSQEFHEEVLKFNQRAKVTTVNGATSKNVLVVYNKNYTKDENLNGIQDSYEIALYYKEKRNLTDKQILGIYSSSEEEIVYESYDAYYDQTNNDLNIRQQIENYLDHHLDTEGHSLKYKIRFIALCKGIPLKIKFMSSTSHNLADYSSVDASLSLMFNNNYSKKWGLKNTYFQKDPYGFQLSSHGGFKGFQNPLQDSDGNFYTLNYLVSRLDAYNINDVKAMIDRSINSAKSVIAGDFLIDDHPDKNYDQMPVTASWLKYPSLAYSVAYNDNSNFIYDNPNPVIFYTSHGVHAGMPDGYINNFNFQIADGAAFTTYESYNGFGFTSPEQSSHGQVAEWIAKGGTVGIGNVYEPWSSNIAKELHLSFVYAAGYHWVEAAYQSLANLDFVATIVGDPLTQIRNVTFTDDGSFNDLKLMSTSPKTTSANNSVLSTLLFEFNKELNPNHIPTFDSDNFNMIVKQNKLFLIPKADLPSSVNVTVNNLIASDNSVLATAELSFNTSTTEDGKTKLLYSSLYLDSLENTKDTAQFIFSKYENHSTELHSNENTNIVLNWINSNFLQIELNSTANDEYLLRVISDKLDFVYKFPIKITGEVQYEAISYDFDKDSNEERLEDRDLLSKNGFESYIDNDTKASFLRFNLTFFKEFKQTILVETADKKAYLYGISEDKTVHEYLLNKRIFNEKELFTFDFNADGYDDRLIDTSSTEPFKLIEFDTLANNFMGSNSIALNQKLNIEFSQIIPENIAKEQIRFIPDLEFSIKRTELNAIEIQANTSFLPNTNYMMYIYNKFSDSYEQRLEKSIALSFKTISMNDQKKPIISDRKIEGNKAIINWVGNMSNIDVFKASSIYFNTNSFSPYTVLSTSKFEDIISDSMQVYRLHNKTDSEYSEEIYIKKEQHNGNLNKLNRYQLELPGFTGTVSKLAEFIPNLKSVSIWNNKTQSWQESSFIENLNLWANDFYIDFGTPIQVITEGNINSFIMSGIKDTVVYHVEASVNQYKDHAFIHLGENMKVSDLFKDQNDIIAVALWNNQKQKWSESSYLSIFGRWFNDQEIKKGQSYYVKSKSDIKITYILGHSEIEHENRKKTSQPFHLIANGKRSFNSLNLLIETIKGSKIRLTDPESGESIEQIHDKNSILAFNVGNFKNGWYIGKEYTVEYELHNEVFEKRSIILGSDIINYDYTGTLPQAKQFTLEQNYPNPFNPETTIVFQVIPNKNFALTIYNILGQKIRTFQFNNTKQNQYQLVWNGKNEIGQQVSSGIYFYELRSDSFVDRKKMVMLK
jgi:uncharacterized protein (TIGR03790 family)